MEGQQTALAVPKEVYYVAGAIVLTNLGTIVSLLYTAFKAVWWASKLDSRVDAAQATAVRAHKRIDFLHVDAPESEDSKVSQ